MQNSKKMSLFHLVMVSCALVISIRNLPTIAETQMQMLFFSVLTIIAFIIPGGFISAELATGWPEMGGIAVWVKEAFGKKWGFVASWLQWTYMILSVISMLYFIASSLAFIIDPSLANNRWFLMIVEIVFIWVFTMVNIKGMRVSKHVSTISFLAGVVFPTALILFFSIFYIIKGFPIKIDLALTKKNIIPEWKDLSTLVLFIGFMRSFSGLEVSAAHANVVKRPQRNYPIALLLVVIFALIVNILGSMGIAVIIPRENMSLTSGTMDALEAFLKTFNLNGKLVLGILGFLLAAGQIGGFSSWLAGPVKGLLHIGNHGELPVFCQKINKNGMPTNLLYIQAVIISIIGSAFLLFADSINVAFWISVALSMLMYVSMYILMFLAAIYLRYKHPNVKREFRVPFKNYGIWVIGIIGIIAMVLSFIIAFIPPAQFPVAHKSTYYIVLIGYTIFIYILPFVIRSYKKRNWSLKHRKARKKRLREQRLKNKK